MQNKNKNKWFPGHMNLGKNIVKNNVKEVDLIVNLVDCRAPISTTNFSILKLIQNRPVVFFLGRADLANEQLTKKWLNYFKFKHNLFALSLNCKVYFDVQKSFKLACGFLNKIKNLKFKNIIRIMVVGISNVGKSTLINTISVSKKAKVENRPGVTKSKQWICLNNGVHLLDTPGILPIKLKGSSLILQLTGAVKREEVNVENLAEFLIQTLQQQNVLALKNVLSKNFDVLKTPYEILIEVAKFKKMLLKNEEFDLKRASNFLITQFQQGKFGKITLENPENF